MQASGSVGPHSVRQVEAPYSGEIVNKGKARSPERQLATYLHCNPCVSGLKTLKNNFKRKLPTNNNERHLQCGPVPQTGRNTAGT